MACSFQQLEKYWLPYIFLWGPSSIYFGSTYISFDHDNLHYVLRTESDCTPLKYSGTREYSVNNVIRKFWWSKAELWIAEVTYFGFTRSTTSEFIICTPHFFRWVLKWKKKKISFYSIKYYGRLRSHCADYLGILVSSNPHRGLFSKDGWTKCIIVRTSTWLFQQVATAAG